MSERAVMDLAQEIAAEPCTYGDNCPSFGVRHGRCEPCSFRKAIAYVEPAPAPKVEEREEPKPWGLSGNVMILPSPAPPEVEAGKELSLCGGLCDTCLGCADCLGSSAPPPPSEERRIGGSDKVWQIVHTAGQEHDCEPEEDAREWAAWSVETRAQQMQDTLLELNQSRDEATQLTSERDALQGRVEEAEAKTARIWALFEEHEQDHANAVGTRGKTDE